MKKKEEAERKYNDGLFLRFADSRPQHLKFDFERAYGEDGKKTINHRFSFKVETGDAEAFDLRVGKIENGEYIPKGDIVFFRAGFYNYTRINRDQMAFRHQIGQWYRV